MDLSRQHNISQIKSPLERLSTVTSDLQDAVMRARMQPMTRLFASVPRLIRDLSVELKKKFDLVMEGADTELDRQLIEGSPRSTHTSHSKLRGSRHRKSR